MKTATMKSSKRLVSGISMAVVSALSLGYAASAQADTGWLVGTWSVWNKNGNYCPTTNACTGARYTQASFDTWVPVSNALIYILDPSGAVVGSGGTDDNGYYSIGWYTPLPVANLRVRVHAYHKNSRFWVANTGGGLHYGDTAPFAPTASSGSSPQNVGGWGLGSSMWPEWSFNAYWAGERLWRDVLGWTGLQTANFTNVEVRGLADTIANYLTPTGFFPTSAASGSLKRVQLDANAGYSPQARMMHELGHIATYVSNAWKVGFDYNWPSQGAGGSWSASQNEWGSAAFEEAFATHYGNIAFWFNNADTPTYCNTTTTCYSGGVPVAGTDIEVTSYPFATNNCVANEGRQPISHMRYFWDIFDNRNDADGDTYSASVTHFWQHLHNLAWYPLGTGTDQHEDPWNPGKTAITEPDGRGSLSYMRNYTANVYDTSLLNIDNCWPN
jgi:hypothetical protein